MEKEIKLALANAQQLVNAEGLGWGEAIEYGVEQLEEDGLMGDCNSLELIEACYQRKGLREK